ncbi:15731_t:CDS:1, partial [Dentiscutata heterogama]
SIHAEFEGLIKPKRENRQVTHDEERRFKNSKITRECYSKLNSPVDVNNDPNYTYLNFILDRAFPDPKTEKNSIAFGIAVAFNYLDPTKGIIIVPSEVVEKMNYFLEKMNVPDRESCE